jgi:hypothetical protein
MYQAFIFAVKPDCILWSSGSQHIPRAFCKACHRYMITLSGKRVKTFKNAQTKQSANQYIIKDFMP